MSKPKLILLILAVVLIVIQFVGPSRTNPPVNAEKTIQAELPVPDHIDRILRRSCYDCHSHETKWPWYSYVAPVSWLVIHDVNEGRRHVNFSQWADYSPRKKPKALEEIYEEVSEGTMPLKQYLWIHREARLSRQEVEAVTTWAKETLQQVYGVTLTDDEEYE